MPLPVVAVIVTVTTKEELQLLPAVTPAAEPAMFKSLLAEVITKLLPLGTPTAIESVFTVKLEAAEPAKIVKLMSGDDRSIV